MGTVKTDVFLLLTRLKELRPDQFRETVDRIERLGVACEASETARADLAQHFAAKCATTN